MGQTLAAVTLSTIISNIAISMIAFNTMAEAGFKIDAILISGRIDVSYGGGMGGGGADILFDKRSNRIYASLAGEFGLDPLSVFQGYQGPGGTVVAALVFSLTDPNQLSGWSVSAFWPTSVLRLMPLIGGSSNVWGTMTQFAKNVTNHRGAVVGFGKSTSGPALMFFGTSYRMWKNVSLS